MCASFWSDNLRWQISDFILHDKNKQGKMKNEDKKNTPKNRVGKYGTLDTPEVGSGALQE